MSCHFNQIQSTNDYCRDSIIYIYFRKNEIVVSDM